MLDTHEFMSQDIMNRDPRIELSKDVETRLILIFVTYLYAVWYIVQEPTVDNWNGLRVFVYGIPAMLFMWFSLQKIRELPLITVIALGPVISIFAQFIHLETTSLSSSGDFHWNARSFELRPYLFTLYQWTYFYLTWYFGFFLIVNYFKFTREAITAAEFRARNNQAAMATMRYKLNPHFLFNTLNSISTLVMDKRNPEAESMVENLSRFLRFTIDKTPDIEVSLDEEIDVVQKYIEIERLRFSDKLNVVYDVDPKTVEYMVPNLIVQNLVEYIITHHILSATERQSLFISTRIEQKDLHIKCTIQGILNTPVDAPTLKNCTHIISRLQQGFGDQGRLELLTLQDRQQGLQIIIPTESPPA